MSKLISMVDFVLEQKERLNCLLSHNSFEYYKLTSKYANFLKQPLSIEMFVPCKLVDGVWVVLKEPYEIFEEENEEYGSYVCEYIEAKNPVLFKGFDKLVNQKVNTGNPYIFGMQMKNLTIEDLVKYNLELTPNALKKIGL